ncbi:MAG: LysR family transcriptional regulator [Betaproteobacteria bacterium]|nr:LysR family transcriptional regulator [Betaproteobacteria bacterium]
MTLTELRYIVAVARERHFGRAAEACFVSQPTLSVAIRKLEEELGVTLFERGPAEVTLTPIGRQVVEQAQRVLEETAAIKEIARQGKDPLAGPLRLGAIYTIGPYLLPRLIPILHKRAPQMPLLIQENYTSRLVESLRNGELDVIVIASEIGEPGVLVQPVYDEPFVVALPRGHRWEKRKTLRAEELAEESLLLLGTGHCFRDQVLKVCPALNRAAATPGSLQKTLEGSSLETIRHMVASGVGITVLPVASVGKAQTAAGLLRYRPFARPVPDRRVALAWRKSFPRTQAVEAVRQAIVAAEIPGVMPLDLPAASAA